MLISKDLSIIKNGQKELYKNRKIVKEMKYKLNEYIVKDPSLPTNTSSSSSSTFSLLNPKELPQNFDEKFMRRFITEKNHKR
jgi:hypothetical protein